MQDDFDDGVVMPLEEFQDDAVLDVEEIQDGDTSGPAQLLHDVYFGQEDTMMEHLLNEGTMILQIQDKDAGVFFHDVLYGYAASSTWMEWMVALILLLALLFALAYSLDPSAFHALRDFCDSLQIFL